MNKIYLILLLSVLSVNPAYAHRSPASCTGSGLAINLYADIPNAHIGDVISYSVDIFNGINVGPTVCDATNIQASIVTPDGQTHTIALVRTTLLHGEKDSYPSVATYVVRAQDVQANGTLTASASDIGDIHQNDSDSQGGGNQSVNVTIINTPAPVEPPAPTTPPPAPPVPPVVPPATQTSGGSGFVSLVASPAVVAQIPQIIYSPVISPIFPKTGFAPEGRTSIWNIIVNFLRNHYSF